MLENFIITMDIQINDLFPFSQGGCFIGYTNESVPTIQPDEKATIGFLIYQAEL